MSSGSTRALSLLSKRLYLQLESMPMAFRGHWRSYNSKIDLKKLRPMILKRIENRAKDYPVPGMIPVAEEVLKARELLFQGVFTLLKLFPIVACKFCPEVYIGEKGHGGLNDIVVPVEAFHMHNMFQGDFKHQQRFDFERVPAIVELCMQAGADGTDEILRSGSLTTEEKSCGGISGIESLSDDDIRVVANGTLKAWERLRSGVRKLLTVYPAKVCKHCSEVHIGPSGLQARLCGVFSYESWRGSHYWIKAKVNDLVPPKMVWRRRPQDPKVLLNEGRDYYGHAPAVVDLCSKAGAIVPSKYLCMMKVNGLPGPNTYY
ncbi:APO protein 4, mitochondrial-like isoform X2 [Hibiscus syriacus]|uniref:APO protein 4, mitochondrial-like isoform X2 n=1 Tax=Hibiscus syriacus TaxID=106335 RepID=UPI00192220C7|nr:APO protein 4, mitochondrial-like isoform X2 [Hibiscus syriacus]